MRYIDIGIPVFSHRDVPEDVICSEARKLFQDAGWTVKNDGIGCDTAHRGLQNLYLHPTQFSGVLAEGNIESVLELLKGAKSFQCHDADRHRVFVDMTDEQYDAYLDSQYKAIREHILTQLKTHKRSVFVVTWDPVKTLSDPFRLNRVCHQGAYADRERNFTGDILHSLIEEGYVESRKIQGAMGYRTISERERKEKL